MTRTNTHTSPATILENTVTAIKSAEADHLHEYHIATLLDAVTEVRKHYQTVPDALQNLESDLAEAYQEGEDTVLNTSYIEAQLETTQEKLPAAE
ncbi:hypothetical protein [Salinibaculum rarum]|uniref:hypothetical protein n=1 Tax=Salinibaculum rarum TaxID=3058903 RepID=UPI00265F989A|nr:hypothetical protein [Salinibaculum sp. KK48]